MTKTIYDIFSELQIDYQLHDHEPFYTCDQSAKWHEDNIDEPSGKSKNLFLRDRNGKKHFLVIIESKKQLDLKQLANQLGESQLSFASPERLKKYLNVEPGSVSLFALIHENAGEVEVIIDEDLLNYEKLHYHPPGRNDQTIMISTNDAKKFMNWLKNNFLFMKL